jgi:hypothetical protein
LGADVSAARRVRVVIDAGALRELLGSGSIVVRIGDTCVEIVLGDIPWNRPNEIYPNRPKPCEEPR